MAVALQPFQLLAAHLQMVSQDGMMLFHLTEAAQARVEDLLTRRKEEGLTEAEEAELAAFGELDQIFTYINAQLALAAGYTPTHERPNSRTAGRPGVCPKGSFSLKEQMLCLNRSKRRKIAKN